MLTSKILRIIFYPGIFFIICLGFFFEWVDRKFYARLQSRYGPIYTDRRGLLQPFADFIKLLSKEDIEHRFVDKYSFTLVPLILLTLPLTAIMCIPFSSMENPIFSFEGDLIFVLFVLTMNAVLTFIAGWLQGVLHGLDKFDFFFKRLQAQLLFNFSVSFTIPSMIASGQGGQPGTYA